jgi:Ulp1 family protease
MDSLKTHNGSAIAKSLRVFLKYELERRKAIALELKEEDLPFVQPAVLQQPNLVDCGLYVLRYAEEFIARAAGSTVTIVVTQTEVNDQFANHEFVNWFTQSEIDVMRAAHKCTIKDMGQSTTRAAPGIQ